MITFAPLSNLIKFKKMKLISLIVVLLLSFNSMYSQSVGINTNTPNPKAVLDLVPHLSQPQGVLLPRLSTSERLSMNATLTIAEKSLLVFDTDEENFFWWNGSLWKNLSSNGVNIIGSNANSSLTILTVSPSVTSAPLNDIVQTITTGNDNLKLKISGMARFNANSIVYNNVDQQGIIVIPVILQRAEDAGFTINLTDLQISRCTPVIKIADARNTTTSFRTILQGPPCTIPIEYVDDVLPNTTYFYRLLVTRIYGAQAPTAGNITVQDRSLSIIY